MSTDKSQLYPIFEGLLNLKIVDLVHRVSDGNVEWYVSSDFLTPIIIVKDSKFTSVSVSKKMLIEPICAAVGIDIDEFVVYFLQYVKNNLG